MKPCIRLPLVNASNVRDLGGYATHDGMITKWQTFIRADDLKKLNDSDIAFLTEYGITDIIDLRSAGEVGRMPHPDLPALQAYHIPLIAEERMGDLMQMRAKDMGVAFVESFYLTTLEASKAQVKCVFEAMHKAKGAVLFHCVGGKDRTGMIAALLLSLARVPKLDIVTNYEVTYTNLMARPNFYDRVSDLRDRGEAVDHYYSCREYMIRVLQHLEDHYGGAREYLLSCGLPESTLEDLRTRFTEKF